MAKSGLHPFQGRYDAPECLELRSFGLCIGMPCLRWEKKLGLRRKMSSRDDELSDLCEKKFCLSNWMAPVCPRTSTPADYGE
jgi:hypothetical protein